MLPSIGALVEIWIELIGRGVWATNPDGSWVYADFEDLAADVQQLGV